MTSTPGSVSIRPPLVIRIYVVAFSLFWVGACLTILVQHGGQAAPVALLFIVFGLGMAYRLLRLGVTSDPTGALVVRNNFGSRRLTRAEIEEFRIGSIGGLRLTQRTVQALLRDGTVYELDICRVPLGRKRVTRQLEELNSWLHDPTGSQTVR